MAWEIEYTDEFENWWRDLSEDEQDSVLHYVRVLEIHGPSLSRPYADTVKGSRFVNMKELRVQHAGCPLRVFYAFDPRRTGILLIGGDKTGNPRFYETYVPIADAIFEEHLRELQREQ